MTYEQISKKYKDIALSYTPLFIFLISLLQQFPDEAAEKGKALH